MSRTTARRCRRNLRRFPALRVLNLPFEDWPVETGASDLVLAATAFHWLNPRLEYCRAAAALRPGGSLALTRNSRLTPEDRLHRELAVAYAEIGLKPRRAPRPETRLRRRADSVARSGRFGRTLVRRYHWTRSCTGRGYLDLLRTMPDQPSWTAPSGTGCSVGSESSMSTDRTTFSDGSPSCCSRGGLDLPAS
ncbi:class I SAM-dependent methyltransferase [candidate division WOR-3 bacterium]|nr:class I SAM-dependent methyltransferase [candidate division WOR-3 bacterium]